MLPKKLFTPKCLHTDRDIVFHEDLENFFNFVIFKLSQNDYIILKENQIENKIKEINNINCINNIQTKSYKENSDRKITKQNIKNVDNTNSMLDSDNINPNVKSLLDKNFQTVVVNYSNSELEKADNILNNLNFKTFKHFWKLKKMSMLHFSKSKEENPKEYYEVLFGEVQNFILYGRGNKSMKENKESCYKQFQMDKAYKILAIYSLYSLYYTQTSEFFYQINTIPEVLFEINKLLKSENSKNLNCIFKKEIAMIVKKLHADNSFSIGALIGLKTVILNKYGLPLEQRTNVYKDYVDINNTKIILDKMKIDEKEKNQNQKINLEDYVNIKRETVDLMKNLKLNGGDATVNFNFDLYCDFINEKLKSSSNPGDLRMPYSQDNNLLNFDLTFFPNNMDMLNLREEDFDKNKITNLDLQFNQIEDNI